MRVALEVWSNRYDEVRETCLLAEELGFDAFYYGESPNELNLECWTTLAALAASTSRIRIGPVITNILPTYRSAHLLARQASCVAEISAGRLDFRTGVGAAASFARPWWVPYGVTYPDYDERLADAAATLDTLAAAWADGPTIPVTIAARGERAMRLTAASAEVWETSFATPAEFAARRADLDRLVGHRPITRSLEIDGFVATTEAGVDRLLKRVAVDRGDEDLGPVLERALVGTPDRVAATLDELRAVGVDQVLVALHDPHDRDALLALARARTALSTADG